MLIAGVATMVAAPACAADNQCTFSGDLFTNPVDFGKIASVPAILNLARDSNRPSGSTIGPVTSRQVTINCGRITAGAATDTGGYRIRMRVLNKGTGTSSNDIAIAPGIGLRISNVSPGNVSQAIVAGDEASWKADIPHKGGVTTDTVEFRLVTAVPAAPAAGTYVSPRAFVLFADTDTVGNTGPVVTSPASDPATYSKVTVAVPTCSASDVAVTLPTVKASDLPSVGSVTGSTPFAITLACPQGYRSLPIRLFMTFTDNYAAPTSPQRQTSLALSPASTARGVQVRINREDTGKSLVSYSADSPAPGNGGQFNTDAALPPDAAGAVTVRFSASYVRTGTIAGGTVNAAATYTLSYQ